MELTTLPRPPNHEGLRHFGARFRVLSAPLFVPHVLYCPPWFNYSLTWLRPGYYEGLAPPLALLHVRQELSRHAALSSVSQPINDGKRLNTRFQNKSEVAVNSATRIRGASARPFVDSAYVGPDVCRYCKKPGHWAYNCPVLKRRGTSADTREKFVTSSVKTGKNIVIDRSDSNSTNVLNSPSKVKKQE